MGGENEIISVLIIEDHPIFREAIKEYLEAHPDKFQVVGDAGTSEDALHVVEHDPPDLVLLDLGLPEKTEEGLEEGLELIQKIRLASDTTKIVVLTAHRQVNVVFRAIRAGAVAYLLKDHVTGKEVIDSLLRVQAGDPPVDPEVARKLYAFFQDPAALGDMPFDGLTDRELQVLRLIGERKSNLEIAQKLSISPRTVKKHVSNILSKLQLHSRMELLLYYRTKYAALERETTPPATLKLT